MFRTDGSSAINVDRSFFGGCNRLLLQYRAIGSALRAHERRTAPFALVPQKNAAMRDFGAELAYVPVEVIESYREDLLDPDLGDERLFIELPGIQLSFAHLGIVACGFCLLGGSIAMALAENPFLSVSLGCGFALLVLAIGFTRHRSTRRMRFASLLTYEINRRRGGTREGMIRLSTSHLTTVQ